MVAGSILLAADNPAALARFYAALLEVEAQPGLNPRHWRLSWPAGGQLQIYAPARARPQPRQSGRLALGLQRSTAAEPLAVMQTWIAACAALGATLLEAPRHEIFGVEAWLGDPEGNRLLLLVHSGPEAPDLDRSSEPGG
ncbi:MAG: VOC family protein [Cyanobium sp.]